MYCKYAAPLSQHEGTVAHTAAISHNRDMVLDVEAGQRCKHADHPVTCQCATLRVERAADLFIVTTGYQKWVSSSARTAGRRRATHNIVGYTRSIDY